MVGPLAILMMGLFLALPLPAAGAQDYRINFQADRTQVGIGECLNIYWDTDNVQTVYYNNQPVSGIAQHRIECPAYSTTYNLLVTTRDNQQILKQIYVDVANRPGNVNNNNMIIEFWAGRGQIKAGECVTVYWNTANVKEVYYNRQGVSGIHQSRTECPRESATYTLVVITRDNQQIHRQLYVQVSGSLDDRGDLAMRDGQMVDFDRKGRVSDDEDDFLWVWSGGEEGWIIKASNDRDLRLAVLKRGSSGTFDQVSRDDCRDRIRDRDSYQVDVGEDSIVCFRTGDDNYGKFRVTDIRSNNGRLEIDWRVWK
jgi:hypothetical protein